MLRKGLGGFGSSQRKELKFEILNPQSQIDQTRAPRTDLVPTSVVLVRGRRLDGTGGWKPRVLGEIVSRWNELNSLNYE